MSLSIRPRILSVEEWPTVLAPPARLAALDVGAKTLGLALSTPDWQMATPLTTITRTKWVHDLAALEKALNGYGIQGLVVGLPVNMDGSEGPQAQSVKQTVFNLINSDPAWLSGGVVAFWDERLTTSQALDTLGETMSHGKAKSRGALDAMAAQIILDGALHYLRNHLR